MLKMGELPAVLTGQDEQRQLTPMQADFVSKVAAGADNPTQAAAAAGFSYPSRTAYKLMRAAHVQAAIRARQNRLIAASGISLALKTLSDVMRDDRAPASAKVSAARCMLDVGGMFTAAHGAPGDKPIHEMTYAELEAVVQRANDEAAQRLNAPSPFVIPSPGGGEGEG